MTAPISVVIPTLNACEALAGTLGALLPALTAGLVRELVVADGGSADRTLEIADEMGARLVAGVPGRAGLLACGLAAARGDWLLVLEPGPRPAGDWCRALARHMAGRADRAGYFPLSPATPGAGLRLRANRAVPRLMRPLPQQGLLVARRLLDRAATGPGLPDLPRRCFVPLAAVMEL